MKANDKSTGESRTSEAFRRPISTDQFFSFLLFILLVCGLVIVIEKQLPHGLHDTDEPSHPGRFIAEKAHRILQQLTHIGPRPAGSTANEIEAVELLRDEIDKIVKQARSHHIVEVDIQRASGAFNLAFLDGMANVYRDVQNVVVKIGSAIKSPHSLLINCHFDTVIDSPGGSDDGAGCAVMLEVLRVLLKSPTLLRHNVIFLFNGAEENFMPASHGFITQHKWAKEVRTFINLEACGAGGREILFQAGPNHPWILETYSEEVPYPYASSLAQEIFQSGVIPGDTDYRIFRDFGNLSGLDFAWSANGYVYHTKFDTINYVPLGALQRTGDNILALTRGLVQGHQLEQVERFRSGNLVFFDFLGAFVIRWQMAMSDFVNISTVIFSIWTLSKSLHLASKSDDLSTTSYIKKVVSCMVAISLSWILSLMASIAVAATLNSIGRTMSWYARPLWVFLLYVLPLVVISMGTLLYHARIAHDDLAVSPWTRFQLYYDASQIIWTIILVVGVLLRIRSAFIALIWTLGAATGNICKNHMFSKWRGAKWLLLHIGVMGLPFVQTFYLIIAIIYLFIPILGRTGTNSHAEFLTAVAITLLFTLLLTFVMPLILLVNGVERIFSFLTGLFLLSMAVLILTPAGFPYSGDRNAPAPQRFMIAHTRRTFRDEAGDILKTSSGFWIVDMDVNSPHTVDRHVPEMMLADSVADKECRKYLYCGVPYLVPVLSLLGSTHWLLGPEPPIPFPVQLNVTRNHCLTKSSCKLRLKVDGPNHMEIIFSPRRYVQLIGWSELDELPLAGPKWNDRETYFIYYAYGLTPKPFDTELEFKIDERHTGPILDLVVNSHYMFEPHKSNPSLQNFVDKFPAWSTVTSWTATYDSWIV